MVEHQTKQVKILGKKDTRSFDLGKQKTVLDIKNEIELYFLFLATLKKINEINCKNDKYIIILGSKDYIYAKYIYNIGTILITDYKYNFILNKDSLGYSCINNKEPINIFIYEMQIE